MKLEESVRFLIYMNGKEREEYFMESALYFRGPQRNMYRIRVGPKVLSDNDSMGLRVKFESYVKKVRNIYFASKKR